MAGIRKPQLRLSQRRVNTGRKVSEKMMMDMVALKEQKVMEIMEQIGTVEEEEEEVEEMITCNDCNVSVAPSNIQANANKTKNNIKIIIAGARYDLPCRGGRYNGQPL